MKVDNIYIYGRNAVMEALTNKPEVVVEVFISKKSKDKHLQSIVDEADVKYSVLNPKDLPGGLDRDVVHQGVVAEIDERKLFIPYRDFIAKLNTSDNPALLVFGEVQDPQNVGAAIRSATAFGVAGVLIPPHNQAPVNGTVVKVSAGTAFRVPLVAINNVNATLLDLKKNGFWVYGLDGGGDVSLPDEKFEKPTVFVLGNEGEGLRKMTAKACDTMLSIPINSQCESMNASASVAVALYDWSIKHKNGLNT